jgi:hypothetical protein
VAVSSACSATVVLMAEPTVALMVEPAALMAEPAAERAGAPSLLP